MLECGMVTGTSESSPTPISEAAARLSEIEARTEAALGTLEQNGHWGEALEIYRAAGAEVDELKTARKEAAHKLARKLRAYLYLREANALRALGRHAEAAPLAEQELSAAMASGDHLSIARGMFSLGTTCVANGETERGLKLLADAKPMFAHHEDEEHRQGLAWWHIVMAELSNNGQSPAPPQAALAEADEALNILRPLKHYPGNVRAHLARA